MYVCCKVHTKSVKEVIEYYYFWKKTHHYRQWKLQYLPDPRTHPHLVALGDHTESDGANPIDLTSTIASSTL